MGLGSGSEMSDGNKLTGWKRAREGEETFEDVARYWARVSKNKERFALSYLDTLVFSWSVEDVFNRNLFRHQVMTVSLHRDYFCALGFDSCLFSSDPRCSSMMICYFAVPLAV
jgi:hypothetical protein